MESGTRDPVRCVGSLIYNCKRKLSLVVYNRNKWLESTVNEKRFRAHYVLDPARTPVRGTFFSLFYR